MAFKFLDLYAMRVNFRELNIGYMIFCVCTNLRKTDFITILSGWLFVVNYVYFR